MTSYPGEPPQQPPKQPQHHQVALPGAGSFGQRFPGQRDAPVFDRSFPFAPVGLLRRLSAMLLDALIYALPFIPVLIFNYFFISIIATILFFVIPAIEIVVMIMLMGKKGTTPGMGILKMHVIRYPEGGKTKIGVGNAIVRWAVLYVPSVLTAGIWLALLAWSTTRDKTYLRRGWHDLSASSVVQDRREDPPGLAQVRMKRARDAAFAKKSAQAAEEEPSAQQGPWRLVFDDGQAVTVTGDGVVGRAPEPRPDEYVAHVVAIPDPGRSLSKTHASFRLLPNGDLELTDRNSTNGVSVQRDGEELPLTAGDGFALRAGDRVSLGDRQVRVDRS